MGLPDKPDGSTGPVQSILCYACSTSGRSNPGAVCPCGNGRRTGIESTPRQIAIRTPRTYRTPESEDSRAPCQRRIQRATALPTSTDLTLLFFKDEHSGPSESKQSLCSHPVNERDGDFKLLPLLLIDPQKHQCAAFQLNVVFVRTDYGTLGRIRRRR